MQVGRRILLSAGSREHSILGVRVLMSEKTQKYMFTKLGFEVESIHSMEIFVVYCKGNINPEVQDSLWLLTKALFGLLKTDLLT